MKKHFEKGILKLERIINTFIWKGNAQKKHVVNNGTAELPINQGGLAVPNLLHFWNALKLAWVTRLIQSDDSTTWKRLSMFRLGSVLGIEKLTIKRLLSESPHSIAAAASALSNPFWRELLKLIPKLETKFYQQNPKLLGEHPIWNRKDILESKLKGYKKILQTTHRQLTFQGTKLE